MDAAALVTAVLVLGGVGLVFGSLVALANRYLRVWEDPRIDGAVDLLPGTNCGACGFAGCRAFAEGLVEGAAQPAACTNMGEDQIQVVAGFLGVEAGEATQRVARLLCAGGDDVAIQNATYAGLGTCAAAAAVAGGGKGCSWGCLGLDDCARACTFGAIAMSPTALPVVTPGLCTACGDCVEACPKDLFTIMPLDQHLLVQCKSLLEGDAAETLCAVACTGCGRCADDAASGLIEIRDGLAVIDYEKNDRASSAATARCPTGAITWVEAKQFAGANELAGSVDR